MSYYQHNDEAEEYDTEQLEAQVSTSNPNGACPNQPNAEDIGAIKARIKQTLQDGKPLAYCMDDINALNHRISMSATNVFIAKTKRQISPTTQNETIADAFATSDVNVFFNSNKPAALGALAYTRGNEIHLAPGQAHHLPHELWHVQQQRQGRVKPTQYINAIPINDVPELEAEADEKSSQFFKKTQYQNVSDIGDMAQTILTKTPTINTDVIQMMPRKRNTQRQGRTRRKGRRSGRGRGRGRGRIQNTRNTTQSIPSSSMENQQELFLSSTQKLYTAINQENVENVRLLLAGNAVLNPLLIILASSKGNQAIMALLLKAVREFPPELQTRLIDTPEQRYGLTPLNLAISRGHMEIASLLIKAGANVNILGKQNESALHIAVTKQIVSVVEMLLHAGVNISIKDAKGRTPRQLAESLPLENMQITEIIEMLKKFENRKIKTENHLIPDVKLLSPQSPLVSDIRTKLIRTKRKKMLYGLIMDSFANSIIGGMGIRNTHKINEFKMLYTLLLSANRQKLERKIDETLDGIEKNQKISSIQLDSIRKRSQKNISKEQKPKIFGRYANKLLETLSKYISTHIIDLKQMSLFLELNEKEEKQDTGDFLKELEEREKKKRLEQLERRKHIKPISSIKKILKQKSSQKVGPTSPIQHKTNTTDFNISKGKDLIFKQKIIQQQKLYNEKLETVWQILVRTNVTLTLKKHYEELFQGYNEILTLLYQPQLKQEETTKRINALQIELDKLQKKADDFKEKQGLHQAKLKHSLNPDQTTLLQKNSRRPKKIIKSISTEQYQDDTLRKALNYDWELGRLSKLRKILAQDLAKKIGFWKAFRCFYADYIMEVYTDQMEKKTVYERAMTLIILAIIFRNEITKLFYQYGVYDKNVGKLRISLSTWIIKTTQNKNVLLIGLSGRLPRKSEDAIWNTNKQLSPELNRISAYLPGIDIVEIIHPYHFKPTNSRIKKINAINPIQADRIKQYPQAWHADQRGPRYAKERFGTASRNSMLTAGIEHPAGPCHAHFYDKELPHKKSSQGCIEYYGRKTKYIKNANKKTFHKLRMLCPAWVSNINGLREKYSKRLDFNILKTLIELAPIRIRIRGETSIYHWNIDKRGMDHNEVYKPRELDKDMPEFITNADKSEQKSKSKQISGSPKQESKSSIPLQLNLESKSKPQSDISTNDSMLKDSQKQLDINTQLISSNTIETKQNQIKFDSLFTLAIQWQGYQKWINGENLLTSSKILSSAETYVRDIKGEESLKIFQQGLNNRHLTTGFTHGNRLQCFLETVYQWISGNRHGTISYEVENELRNQLCVQQTGMVDIDQNWGLTDIASRLDAMIHTYVIDTSSGLLISTGSVGNSDANNHYHLLNYGNHFEPLWPNNEKPQNKEMQSSSKTDKTLKPKNILSIGNQILNDTNDLLEEKIPDKVVKKELQMENKSSENITKEQAQKLKTVILKHMQDNSYQHGGKYTGKPYLFQVKEKLKKVINGQTNMSFHTYKVIINKVNKIQKNLGSKH